MSGKKKCQLSMKPFAIYQLKRHAKLDKTKEKQKTQEQKAQGMTTINCSQINEAGGALEKFILNVARKSQEKWTGENKKNSDSGLSFM